MLDRYLSSGHLLLSEADEGSSPGAAQVRKGDEEHPVMERQNIQLLIPASSKLIYWGGLIYSWW